MIYIIDRIICLTNFKSTKEIDSIIVNLYTTIFFSLFGFMLNFYVSRKNIGYIQTFNYFLHKVQTIEETFYIKTY